MAWESLPYNCRISVIGGFGWSSDCPEQKTEEEIIDVLVDYLRCHQRGDQLVIATLSVEQEKVVKPVLEKMGFQFVKESPHHNHPTKVFVTTLISLRNRVNGYLLVS